MKKLFLFLNSAFLIFNFSFAQSPNWFWAKRMGAPLSGDVGNSVVVDAFGNVYITGGFQGTVDFDPGPGVFNLTPNGAADIFVCKLDSSGNFIWAKAMGGPSNINYDRGSSITIDAAGSGEIYATGVFDSIADFDPGPGIFNLTAVGGLDIFILKLDTSGNFIWAKAIGGTNLEYTNPGNSIAIDPAGSGDIYAAGYFSDTVDFDPGPGVFNLIANGTYDIFILKLDSSGNFVWAKKMGGLYDDRATSIFLDASANIYTTGIFSGTADFDPGVATFNLVSTLLNEYDIFISKLDSVGNFIWAKQISGTSYKYGYSLALDPAGNVYSTGRFWGTVDLDPGIGVYNLITPVLSSGVYVSKLDNNGNFLWARQMSGIGPGGGGVGRAIAVDTFGNSYTSGVFSGTIDFDPNVGIDSLASAGFDDIFITKLDSSGNFIWAKKAGGTGPDALASIYLDLNSKVHVTGFFAGPSITFGPIVLADADSTNSYGDIFIAKLDKTIITGNDERNNLTLSLNISPSPFTAQATVTFNKEVHNATFSLYNLLGEKAAETTGINGESFQFNRGNLPSGVYVFEVREEGNKIYRGKAVAY